jgi:hypothetical protein
MKYIKLFEENQEEKLARLKRLGLIDPGSYYTRVMDELEEAGISISSSFNRNDEAFKSFPNLSNMVIGVTVSYNEMEFDLEWDESSNYSETDESRWHLSWNYDFDEIDSDLSLAEVIDIIKSSTPKPEEDDTDFEVDDDLLGLPKDAQKTLMKVRKKIKDLGLGKDADL